MSRQQMSFQLAYGTGKQLSKCKSCQGQINSESVAIGVKSDAMYDPMWYHSQCFWTRCWYRKQMSRHLHDFTDLAGFAILKAEDKQKFRDSLHELLGIPSDGQGLKRRSISEDNLVDVVNKRTRPNAASTLPLPKLSLSAIGFISRSRENLAESEGKLSRSSETTVTKDFETLTVSKEISVEVKKAPEGLKFLILFKSGGNSTTKFEMTEQQWRKMFEVNDDLSKALESKEDKDFSLLDNQLIRVTTDDIGAKSVQLTSDHGSGGKEAKMTFTPDQWMTFTKRGVDIDCTIKRLLGR